MDVLSTLPLPPRSTLALISLLRACRPSAAPSTTTPTTVPAATSADAMDVDTTPAAAPAVAELPSSGVPGRLALSDPALAAGDPAALVAAYATALEAGCARVEVRRGVNRGAAKRRPGRGAGDQRCAG